MAVYNKKASTGIASVDKAFDHLIDYINRLNVSGGSSSSTTINPYYFVTELGGHAYRVENLSGITLSEGYLVKVSSTSTGLGVTLSNEDDFEGIGAVHSSIPPYSTSGYVVMLGPANVYFNANGATAGQLLRMSRSDDTVNTDTGKAQSTTIDDVDANERIGEVTVGRSGEGLSRCFIKR